MDGHRVIHAVARGVNWTLLDALARAGRRVPDELSRALLNAGQGGPDGEERDVVTRAITFWESDVFLRRHGALIQIDKPRDAEVKVQFDGHG